MIKSIVITGSTRGIGYFLAAEFLARDYAVTISGRTSQGVDEAVVKLQVNHNKELIYGVACDVNNYSQVETLWEAAKNQFGRLDIWINNAGMAVPMMKFWEVEPGMYDEVVHSNLIGTMYGTKVALREMLKQGYGALYNLEGFGARGRSMHGMALYGSTKAGVHFLNKSLAQETDDSPVITGAIAPGMVITEMITRQFEGREAELEKSKRILNIIAERPETVAPVLVDRILKNQKNGATITYSSTFGMMAKFLKAPFNKRDLFT